MPTYEYQCDACGQTFEYFQSMSEAPKAVCESCGGKLSKLMSAGSGLIFKGSGFYITDYKSGKSDSKGSDSSKGSESSSTKESGPAKTETTAPKKADSDK